MSTDIINNTNRNRAIAVTLIVVVFLTLGIGQHITSNKQSNSQGSLVITQLPSYSFPGQVQTAPDFTLPSITGQNYTFSSDAGKIRLVDFFYTKCPGNQGCALITQNMAFIYDKLKQNNQLNQVKLISIDFDYINDTMTNLQAYAANYTQDTTNWQFLLGNAAQTNKTTSEWGFYYQVNNATATTTTMNSGPKEPYIHTLMVYFIDQTGHWRYSAFGNTWTPNDAYTVISWLLTH